MMAMDAMVLVLAASAVVASWFYFRRWALTRPPLGTVNLGDVAFTIGTIIMLPLFYMWIPAWLNGTLLAIVTASIIWYIVEPVTTLPVVRAGIAGGLVAADVLLFWLAGTNSTAYLLVNDVVVIAITIGVSNLWAQGGLRARDLAILAGAVTVYDLVVTGLLPLTADMLERLSGMPFLPMAVWPAGAGQWSGIGLGDLLMASVGPLVMRKAFGWAAGVVAMAIALAAIAGVLLVTRWGAMPDVFPTMIVLGPLMVAQYGVWKRRAGEERTYARYLSDEPIADSRLGRRVVAFT